VQVAERPSKVAATTAVDGAPKRARGAAPKRRPAAKKTGARKTGARKTASKGGRAKAASGKE